MSADAATALLAVVATPRDRGNSAAPRREDGAGYINGPGDPRGRTLRWRGATRLFSSANTEIFGFEGDLIARTEVYFGWNL
jgi:hypothetical protein